MPEQSQRRSFDQILIDAIDESLSTLGENVATSIYFHLDALFKIKRHEIPSRIDDFSLALERIFGLGARCLEIMFMKNLHSKIETTPQGSKGELTVPELTFKEYVSLMKKIHEERTNQEKLEFLINENQEKQLCKSL